MLCVIIITLVLLKHGTLVKQAYTSVFIQITSTGKDLNLCINKILVHIHMYTCTCIHNSPWRDKIAVHLKAMVYIMSKHHHTLINDYTLILKSMLWPSS